MWLPALILLAAAEAAIIGEPTIRCDDSSIRVRMEMEEVFTGHVYLQGHHGQEGCHLSFRDGNSTDIEGAFSMEGCRMRRKRESNPRGLRMSAVMVVAHHDTLITWRDRAYNIECFFIEHSREVTRDLNVSSLSAPSTVLRSEPALPTCEYKVLQETEGDSIATSIVGAQVTHRWECRGEAEMHCMRVHSCHADDGKGTRIRVVDEQGCSLEKELLADPVYDSAMSASAPSKMFKFADQSEMYFACQVQLSLKHDHNGTCPKPHCSSRAKRAARFLFGGKKAAGDYDLIAPRVTVLEGGRAEVDLPASLIPSSLSGCSSMDANPALLLLAGLLTAYTTFSLCYLLHKR